MTATVAPASSLSRMVEFQSNLEYTTGGSDKIYVIQILSFTDASRPGYKDYAVVGFYGRRGIVLRRVTRCHTSFYAEAEALAKELESRKIKQGYIHFTRPVCLPAGEVDLYSKPSVVTADPSIASKPRGPMPMLASWANEKRMATLLDENEWAAQRKYNGERVIISIKRSGIVATNRKGVERPLPRPLRDRLHLFLEDGIFRGDRETILDGELVKSHYYAFDCLKLRGLDFREFSFLERYSELQLILKSTDAMSLADVAWTSEEKRGMLRLAETLDWEGLIFRDTAAPYFNGRSTSVLKLKLWSSCTCQVAAVTEKRSIQLGMLPAVHPRELVAVGNVTVPASKAAPSLKVGDLVEVRYQYALEDGSLYQPVFLGIRTDVDLPDHRYSLKGAPPEKRKEAEAPLGAKTPSGPSVAKLSSLEQRSLSLF